MAAENQKSKEAWGDNDAGDNQDSGEPDYVDKYIACFINWPCTCCLSCGLVIFVLAVLSSMAGFMTVERRPGAWWIWGSEWTQMAQGLLVARETATGETFQWRRLASEGLASELLADDSYEEWLAKLPPVADLPHAEHRSERRLLEAADAETTYQEMSVSIYYKTNVDATGTMFTPQRLQQMCQLEKAMMTFEPTQEYQGKPPEVNFTAVYSPVLIFYSPTPGMMVDLDSFSWACALLSQESVDNTTSIIKASLTASGAESPYSSLVREDAKDTGETPYSVTRVFYKTYGLQLAKDMVTPLREALGLVGSFFTDGYICSGWFMGDNKDKFRTYNDIRVRIYSVSHIDSEIYDILNFDFAFALISVVAVWLIMCYHLGSCFLGSMGMFQILFSLPVAGILYKVFQINYFEFLHILVVYLVLGIGADDLFVLVDSFRHFSADIAPTEGDGRYSDKTLHKVLRATLLRSAGAIFNTSFTTTVAFLACSVSKIMPMRTCGYFAAFCIVLNFIFTITYSPAFLVIWHRRLQGKRCCCPGWGLRDVATLAQKKEGADGKAEEAEVKGCVEVLMNKYYTPMMQKEIGGCRVFALVIFILLLITAIQGAAFAFQLTPPSKPEAWLPPRHMFLGISEFQGETYYQPDYKSYNVVEFYWGIKEVDMSTHDIYYPNDNWKESMIQWDPDFDLSTAEAQASFLDTCDELKRAECTVDACMKNGYPSGTIMMQAPETTHSCWMEDFQIWNRDRYNDTALPTGADFMPRLQEFRDTANPKDYSDSSAYVEDHVDYKGDIGIIDGKLRYAIIKVRSVVPMELTYAMGNEFRKVVWAFVESRRGKGPKFNGNFKTIDYFWSFCTYQLNEELIAGFFSGCAIALPVAFLVLLLSTKNIIVATIAVFSVGSIVLCVLGFCKSAMGWDLGVGESVAGVIVIGYSVDYVVHLAHMYCDSKHFGKMTRDERCAFTIKNMGSTVFMGAITTAVSGGVMFLCYVYFFFKMAILIVLTIIYSLIFSLGFFMAAMWLIGPENDFGDFTLPNVFGGKQESKKVADAEADS